MPSEFSYGTFANYSPKGNSSDAKRSRFICGKIKAGSVAQIEQALPKLAEPEAAVLQPFLNPQVTLVPVPRSAPLREGTLWPSRVIADVLHQAGYGLSVEPLLERITAVPKSAFAARGERPLVHEHQASLRVQAGLLIPEEITLVDDVLTMVSTTGRP